MDASLRTILAAGIGISFLSQLALAGGSESEIPRRTPPATAPTPVATPTVIQASDNARFVSLDVSAVQVLTIRDGDGDGAVRVEVRRAEEQLGGGGMGESGDGGL